MTPNGNGTVSVTTAADGSDTLRSIELLSFSDGLYTVGQFAAPGNAVIANFGPGAGGWSSQTQFPRHAADVTGDGRADILGFGQAGVFLSISQSDGTFPARRWRSPTSVRLPAGRTTISTPGHWQT